jgi:hypothetical protein
MLVQMKGKMPEKGMLKVDGLKKRPLNIHCATWSSVVVQPRPLNLIVLRWTEFIVLLRTRWSRICKSKLPRD